MIQVLVPTHSKTNDECKKMVSALNISTNCLICNQKSTEENFNDDRLAIKNFIDCGVSVNRNNLLTNCSGDICVCVDDDCPLVDNYEEIINKEFEKFPDADFILFNGIVTHENNRLVHNKKTKKVHRFNEVSFAGGPGLVFKKEAIKKYKVLYNTKVGYPNKISFGEDTLFIKSIINQKANFVRSNEVLFIIKDDVDNSSYFKGVTEDFVISKGCVTKIIHPRLFWLYKYHYASRIKNWRNNQFSFKKLVHLLKEGSKLSKNII